MSLLSWDIYEVHPHTTPVVGVMFRGRVRKFCLGQKINILLENTVDVDGRVRFALLHQEDPNAVIEFIKSIAEAAEVECIKKQVHNPVLSKIKVNIEERYTI